MKSSSLRSSLTFRTVLVIALVSLTTAFNPVRSPLTVAYTLRIDSLRLDVAEISIALRYAPATFHLAMKVHAEYDGQYWRYLDGMTVESTSPGGVSSAVREDSTLWRVNLPGGSGVVKYRVHIQPTASGLRGAWRPAVRADGALINGPDFFLYGVEFSGSPVTLDVNVPRSWRVASSLAVRDGLPLHRTAPDAATFLDAPILLGALREWRFTDRGTTFHVVYWPLPNASPFDTLAFVRATQRLSAAATDVFGRATAPDFYFLFQDGADDALEHRASVTVGVPSASIAAGRTPFYQIAHEFFHAWNIVSIRPAGYNQLSYRAPARTTGLWVGEGVTLYYADLLLRRAGNADTTQSRLDHLATLVQRYYGSPAMMRVGPERASLAFGDSPAVNPDATGGYYVQGELLGNVLDGFVRDSTHERRGLDDVMRALFALSLVRTDSGFTSRSLEAVTDSVCACRLNAFFATQVRGSATITIEPLLTRFGLRLQLDSIPMADSAGHPLPDARLGLYTTDRDPRVSLALTNYTTPWYLAGLRTGDVLDTFGGSAIRTMSAARAALNGLHVGDRVSVQVQRSGQSMRFDVTVTGYLRPRARFVDLASVTALQRARRAAWSGGR